MDINTNVSVGTTNTEISTGSQTELQTDALGQDAFLKLLLAQLQNQDPLQPMEDKDFIAQLAQFNSLNELTKLNKTLEEFATAQVVGQGSALIGKTVSGLTQSGDDVAGTVTGFRVSGGAVILDVSGRDLPLAQVKSVQGEDRSTEDDQQTQSSVAPTT